MTVYVDDVRHRLGKMIMCHMWADTIAELLEMADRIGVQRKWIQGHPELSVGKAKRPSWIHFDIALSKKALALAAGAVLTDKYGPSEFVWRGHLEHPDERVRGRANQMLEQIAEIRARGTA